MFHVEHKPKTNEGAEPMTNNVTCNTCGTILEADAEFSYIISSCEKCSDLLFYLSELTKPRFWNNPQPEQTSHQVSSPKPVKTLSLKEIEREGHKHAPKPTPTPPAPAYDLYKLIYSKKYRDMGATCHLRHCFVGTRATGPGPKNVLVMVKGGKKIIVPKGNLDFVKTVDPSAETKDLDNEFFRNSLKEINHRLPEEFENPIFTAYQRLSDQDKALCLKPNPFLNNERGDFEPVDEVDTSSSLTWNNPEEPDNLSFIAMGCNEAKNPALDATQTGRVLREFCYQSNNRNYFLFEKAAINFQGQNFQRPEWIAQKIGLHPSDADTIANSFRSLNLDYKTTSRILFGHHRFELTEIKNKFGELEAKFGKRLDTKSVKGMVDFPHLGEKCATVMENLVDSLEADGPSRREQERQHFLDVSNRLLAAGQIKFPTPAHQMQWIENKTDAALEQPEPDSPDPRDVADLIELGFCEEDPLDDYETEADEYLFDPEDETPLNMGDSNPYSGNPLGNENDRLSHEFSAMIKSATTAEISLLISRMFSTFKDSYAGTTREIRAEYWYFTDDMKSHFWVLVKARQAELKKEISANPSADLQKILNWIEQAGKTQMATSAIFAWSKGEPAEFYGYRLDWTGKADKTELALAWEAYKEL